MAMFIASDGEPRCGWAATTPEMLDFHDTEWGFPVAGGVTVSDHVEVLPEQCWLR